jgi:uncharacterized damage-inducible protein DinB
MEIDAVRLFDYLAGARGRLLAWVRDLHAERPGTYTITFPFGHGSIRATLLHVAAAEWAYVERLRGRDFPLSESPFTSDKLPALDPFVRAWEAQAARTRAAIGALVDPRRPVEFISRIGPVPVRAQATAGEIIVHMALHEVHHRAQVMAMLRQSGVAAENLDYSILAFTRTPAGTPATL